MDEPNPQDGVFSAAQEERIRKLIAEAIATVDTSNPAITLLGAPCSGPPFLLSQASLSPSPR